MDLLLCSANPVRETFKSAFPKGNTDENKAGIETGFDLKEKQMKQKKVLSEALSLVENQRQHNRWLRAMAVLGAAVVFLTIYLLMLPAITMEHSSMQVTATPSKAPLGESIYTEVKAEAKDENEETVFVLKAKGDNAGLDESALGFDEDGVALIEGADNEVIALHRVYGKNGINTYYFSLPGGQAVRFSLPWVNGTDRYKLKKTKAAADELDTEDTSSNVDDENKESAFETETQGNSEHLASASNAKKQNQNKKQAEHVSTKKQTKTVYVSVLDKTGNVDKAGSVRITYAASDSLEHAQRRTGKKLELSWLKELEGEAAVIPANATSWATVVKEGFDASDWTATDSEADAGHTATASNAGNIRRNAKAALAQAEGGYDFTNNITSITVSKLVNGQWQQTTEFNDRDQVQTVINYKIPANTVGTNNRVIYYQLPTNGFKLDKDETGTVYDGSNAVGTYVIGKDGKIVITFDANFADSKAFTGTIQFTGRVYADGENDQNITFAGTKTTITVKANKTAIGIEKEGEYDKQDKKLHYTLTVSSKLGTKEEVNISDKFNGGTGKATYDKESFHIVKVDKDGNKTDVTGFEPEIMDNIYDGRQYFNIKGLPKLEAGEKYIVTYTADPSKAMQPDGSYYILNNANANSGNNNAQANKYIEGEKKIAKYGSYNSTEKKIYWTITVNQNKQDISGCKLSDEMTINGKPYAIPAGTVFTIKATSTGKTETFDKLPYTFPAGSTDEYTITYQVDIEAVGDPGSSWTATNFAYLDNYYARWDIVEIIPGYYLTKNFEKLLPSKKPDEKGYYQWKSILTVPNGNVNVDAMTLTDMLHQLVPDSGTGEPEPIPDSHYVTPKYLKDNTTLEVQNSNGQTDVTLEYGTDYKLYDTNGNEITDFTDDTTHLYGFQVKFLAPVLEKATGKKIVLNYQSIVDYTKLDNDTHYKITNSIAFFNGKGAIDTTGYMKAKLDKTVQIGDWKSSNTNDKYTDGPVHVDFDAMQNDPTKKIYYRLMVRLEPDTSGDITITDLLPRGLEIDKREAGGYVIWAYLWKPNATSIYKNLSITPGEKDAEGRTPLTIVIKDGYQDNGIKTNTIAVYYSAHIDDSRWDENPALTSQDYINQAAWANYTDSTTVIVDRKVSDLKKEGEQLPQYDNEGKPIVDKNNNPLLSNTIRYKLLINAGAKDLVEGFNQITLTDVMTVPNTANGAEFQPQSVHLYHYSAEAEGHLGEEIDKSLYSYTYDEKSHKLTFQLPDATAMYLVYDYTIDRGTAAGDLNITNSAKLSGGTSSAENNSVTLINNSSQATVAKKTLKLYKVDANNYKKLLPGAKFQLYVYQEEKWNEVGKEHTTNTDGEIVLKQLADDGNVVYPPNTLYKLVETEPPEGYIKSDKADNAYYFVWVEDGKTTADVKKIMQENGSLGGIDKTHDNVALEKVSFITGNAAFYVPNEPTQLIVKKLWQDKNGLSRKPASDSVTVQLYQKPVSTNAKHVTVTSKGNNPGGWEQSESKEIDVGKGSDLTITITNAWANGAFTILVDGEKIGTAEAVNQVLTYTIQNIETDTKVTVLSPVVTGNAFGQISFSDYREPADVPETGSSPSTSTTKPYGEAVVLNEKNEWSHTYENLPKEVNGKKVHYVVKETTPVPGFDIIYSDNNSGGIQAGELVITNKEVFVLPDTGGRGMNLFALAGIVLISSAGLMYLNRLRCARLETVRRRNRYRRITRHRTYTRR